jgi:hypothetical protein
MGVHREEPRMNRRAVPITVAAFALAAGGCGSSDDSKKTETVKPASSTTSTAGVPQDLLGSYQRLVSKADIERTQKKRSELGPNQAKPKPEKALLFLEPSGLTTRNEKASFVVQQDYSATDAGQLTIRGYQHPEQGSFCGPEIAQNATYMWKKSGEKLILKATTDPCADRDSTLAGTWAPRR